ncbi:MAG TPA: AraC family transcriptional regulator [Planctomicrobium sp.]|nr:AraC family transcriptional regulator [Planctomicrobium sp.]
MLPPHFEIDTIERFGSEGIPETEQRGVSDPVVHVVLAGTWSAQRPPPGSSLEASSEDELRLHPGDLLFSSSPTQLRPVEAATRMDHSILRLRGRWTAPEGSDSPTKSPLFVHVRGTFSLVGTSVQTQDPLRLLAGLLISAVLANQLNLAGSGMVSGVEPEVAQAILAMERAPGEPWTIQRLASEAGISRSTLAQKFKEQTGQTPNDYLLNIRMRLAEEMLRGRAQHLKEIARRAGYQSVSAFSTAFKRWSGSPPSVHRRRPLS